MPKSMEGYHENNLERGGKAYGGSAKSMTGHSEHNLTPASRGSVSVPVDKQGGSTTSGPGDRKKGY